MVPLQGETAELLGLGTPVPLPPLNSFFRNYESKEQQTGALQNWLATQQLEKPMILVTHQVKTYRLQRYIPRFRRGRADEQRCGWSLLCNWFDPHRMTRKCGHYPV